MNKTNNTNNTKNYKGISKFLSYLLRHHPEQIGLTLDNNGWADTAELIDKINQHSEDYHQKLDFAILQEIVTTNPKQRFAFNDDKSKIRANQGHSIEVDLNYQPQTPPQFLYHGTATRFIDSIMTTGINKKNRHHVHLSVDIATAKLVGQRYGKPVILTILAQDMAQAGYQFYRSDNNVWLTDNVPVEFIVIE